MAKGINTNTLLIGGGLLALGLGAFYFMNKRHEQTALASPAAQQATTAAASAAGVTDPAVIQQMLGAMQQMMNKINTGTSKQQAQAELIATYTNMGVNAASQIISAIGSII